MRHAKLPGTPNRRATYVPDADRRVHGRRPHDELRAAVLEVLGSGPLQKWQIRDALHEPENVVIAMLRELRDEGAIRKIGHNRIAQYALKGWNGDVPRIIPGIGKPSIRKAIRPPANSWWVGKSRAEFNQELKSEAAPRMAGMQGRGGTVGWGGQA